MIQWINSNSTLIAAAATAATAIATVVLAAATIVYIRLLRKITEQQINENRKLLIESSRPELKLNYTDPHNIRIINAGKGPAYDIKFNHPKFKRPIDIFYPLFPGEFGEINSDDRVNGTCISYRSIYNERFELNIIKPQVNDEWCGIERDRLKMELSPQRSRSFIIYLNQII